MSDSKPRRMFLMRSSKYRHIYGSPAKKEQCYEGMRITKDAHDSSFCAVNPKFLAIVLESAGGGVFLVQPLTQTGRVIAGTGKVSGHRGRVTDIKWNPFNDNIIASGSDDSTIKLWQIPDGGIVGSLTDCIADLRGHMKKISYIEWHPTAANILLSSAADFKCILWNAATAERLNVIAVHPDTIFSMSWNLDGSLFATTCKDKQIRVVDPRRGAVVAQGTGHVGPKSSKIVFLDKKRLFTTGFSRMSERQYAIWDSENLSKPLGSEDVDASSGILIPYYDFDTKVVFLAGKGDGNIRYFEITEESPYVHFLCQYQSGSPQRGLGVMPKRGVDTLKCEIARFYKLHTSKDLCEPLSMIVPRKSDMFQEDIYPDTAAPNPSLSTEEWIRGQNADPVYVPIQTLQSSQVVMRKTTKKMADELNEVTKKDTSSAVIQSASLSTSHKPAGHVPASLLNIHRLSAVDNQMTNGGSDWQHRMEGKHTSYKTDSELALNAVKESLTTRKTVDQSTSFSLVNTDSSVPASDTELRQAYVNQRNEIANLREQLWKRDRRVEQLEEEVQSLRAASSASEHSILA